ncbi:hypothetical protein BC831DRAFT_115898 [Entophlyctis helioformis]|nr:hypothetical protein BC831DRAFT_115898 [Entophlyctis helioformis]
MDDSTLKALALVPRGSKEPLALVPPFARHTKAYTCMVQSDLEAVAVQAVCNEPDAFSQPQNTSSDGSIAIKEGANNVEVKVDAPDGSSSRYIVQVYRPSASDTSLKEVAVSAGTIVPPISRSETRYTVLIDPTLAKLTVNPVPLNAKSRIKWVCPASPPVDTVLHIGDTAFQFDVTSANGSSTVSYTITRAKTRSGRG